MPDFDDDSRLTEAFARFRDELAPFTTPPGAAPLRFRLRRRRRFGAAAIAACVVLFIGGPAIGLATADRDTPPVPVGPTVSPPSPTPPTVTPRATPTSPSAAPTTAVAKPPRTGDKPPRQLYAVQSTDEVHTLRRWTGTSSDEVFSREVNPPNGAVTGVSDLSFAGGALYAAFCCEPVVGSTAKIVDGERQHVGNGVRVDARGDLVVATDTDGRYTLQIDGDEVIRVENAHATDAAILSDDQFAVLVNPAHFHGGDQTGSDRPALVLRSREGSRWTTRTVLLGRDYCAVVAVAGGVGLLTAQPDFDPALGPCRGERVDLRNLTTGTTRRLALPRPAAEIASDDTGTFILVTGANGRLSWLTSDGEPRPISGPRDVIFADW